MLSRSLSVDCGVLWTSTGRFIGLTGLLSRSLRLSCISIASFDEAMTVETKKHNKSFLTLTGHTYQASTFQELEYGPVFRQFAVATA